MTGGKFGTEAIDALLSESYEIKRLFSLKPMCSDDANRLRALSDAGWLRNERDGTIHEQSAVLPSGVRSLSTV
jgi:hypothetical protein